MSNKCYPFLGKFVVTSPFGPRSSTETYVSRNHKGIDLVSQGSKTVVSVTDGVVKRVASQSAYGNYVWVENNDGTGAIYCHLSSFLCKVGQTVTCKTPIGIEGSTGNSTGSHLHFGISTCKDYSETHVRDSWFNPAIYFGINNYTASKLKGMVFNGSGMIEGMSSGVYSTNQSSSSSNTISYSSSGSVVVNDIKASGEFYEIKDLKGVTTDWLYGRRYRCIVDLGNNQAFDVSELRCTFEIIKSAYFEANQSLITIYNLNPENENKLIKAGQRIIIEAGYNGDQYGKIFEGNVIQPLRSKENGVDYKLTLVSMDSDRYVTYGLVGVSLVAQQSARDAVTACVEKCGQLTGYNYGMQEGVITEQRINYPRGKVLFGSPTYYLNQIAKSMNSTYYNEDGTVNIISPKDLANDVIFDLGPETGLIGSPLQTEYGISCSCLLNPRMKINSLFHLDNKKIENYRYTPGKPVRPLDNEGIYRVIKITHKGDTRGDDWTTEIEAISQAGMLPGMAVGDSVYIY